MYLELRGCKSAEGGVLNACQSKSLVSEIVIQKISVESDQSAGSDRIEAMQSQLLDDMQTLILLQDSSDRNQVAVDNNACSSLIASPHLLSSWSHPGRTKNRSAVVSQLISIGSSTAAPPRPNEHSSLFSDESTSEMQGNVQITMGTDLGAARDVQDMKIDLISACDELQGLIPDHQQICGDSDLTCEHHMADPESSKSSTEGAPEYDVDRLQQHTHLTTSSGLNATSDTTANTTNMQQQEQQPAEDPSLPSAELLMTRIQPLALEPETNLKLVEQSFFPATPFLHDDRNTDHVDIDTRPKTQRHLLAEARSKDGLTGVTVTSEPASTSGVLNSEAAEVQQSHDIHGYLQQHHDNSTDEDDKNNNNDDSNNNNSSSNKLMSRSTFNLHEYSCPGSLDHHNQGHSWTLAAASATAGSKRRLPETGFNGEPPHEWLQLSLSSSNSAEAAAAGATATNTGYSSQLQSMSSDLALNAPALQAAGVVKELNLGVISHPREPGEFLNSDLASSLPLCTSLSVGRRPPAASAAVAVFNTSCTREGKTVHSASGARACHNDLGLEGPLLEQLEICRPPSHPRPSSTDHDLIASYKRLQTLPQTSAQLTRQISTSSSSSKLLLMTTAAASLSCSDGELMRGAAAAGGLDDSLQLMSSSSRRSLTTTTRTTTHMICTTSPDPGSSTSRLQQKQQIPFSNCNWSSPAAAAGHLQFQLLGRSASSSSSHHQQPPDQTSSFGLPFPEREFIGRVPAAACNNILQSNPAAVIASPAWATQATAPPAPAARDFANCSHNKLTPPNVEPHLSAQFLEGLMPSSGMFPTNCEISPLRTGLSSNTGFPSSQSTPHRVSERTTDLVGNNFCKEIQFGVLQDGMTSPQLPDGHIITGGSNNYQRSGAPPRNCQLAPPCPLPGLGQSATVHMPASGGFQPGAAARLGFGWPLSSSSKEICSTTMNLENLGLVVVEGGGGATRGRGNTIEKGSTSASPDSWQKLLKSVPGPSVTICQPPTILPQDVNHHFLVGKRAIFDPPSLHLNNYAEGMNQPSSLRMRQMTTPWAARLGPSLDPALGFTGQVQANVFNGETNPMRTGSSSLPGHHHGLWFTLRAALNQTRTPILEQIPQGFLQTKDEHMTVLVVKKYLIGKLGLESHSQVEISCNGQQLEPSLTLRHVRDTIWRAQNVNNNNNAVGVGESFTKANYKLRPQDVVMVLTYSRLDTHQSPTRNLLHSLT